MVSILLENMKNQVKPKNLLGGEETPHEKESPQKVSLTVEGFLTQMGIEWEEKGRAVYIYPSSLQGIKEILEKIPLPEPDRYYIIPLGTIEGYSVFIMMTRNSTSLRIGYGRNSIPFSPTLFTISEKLTKVMKEIGVETRKNGRNLLG